MRFLDKGWKKIIAVIIKLLPQKYTNVGLNLLGIRVGNKFDNFQNYILSD